MRIAYLPDETTANTVYRSIGPMLTLGARGHELRQLDTARIGEWPEALAWCELLHIHRVCDGGAVELARAARAAGAAVVWDDDDDVTRVPRGTSGYREAGGLKGVRRLNARAKLFEQVDLVTTPSAQLAETFRAGGARAIEVIENFVPDRLVGERLPRDGLRVGWVAGFEHRLDLAHIPLVDALRQLLEAHPQVRVTTVGLKLDLHHERYTHVSAVPLLRLLRHVATFDIGIAPLSPTLALNDARSNVKLKEYAAVGVPWLASPIGPYAGLGERQGGRLVADDRWFDELSALVDDHRARRKLAKRATKWGREQMLSRNVGLWERSFERLVAGARGAG